MRSVDIPPTSGSISLSDVRVLGSAIRSPWFLYAVQAVVLVGLVGLAILGLVTEVPDGVDAKLVAKGSLVTLVIWGLWWPSMIWGSVLLGRAWCTICPLELVSNVTERLARRLGIGGRTLGRWLRAGWISLLLYVAMQLLVAGMSMHRSPWLTGVMMLTLLAVAIATSLAARDRAFCRGFCPVRLLLGSYGRFGGVAVRAVSNDACDECEGRYCTSSTLRYEADGRSCPSLLDPSRLATSAECLACVQCVKVCQPQNMKVLLRAPFHGADDRPALAPWATTMFVVIASSFVVAELAAEWPAAKKVVQWAPAQLEALLSSKALDAWTQGLWIVVVVPAVLALLFGLVAAGGRFRRIPTALRRIAVPLVVVVAFGHMSKAFIKATSWVGFLPHAVEDPLNRTTSAAVAAELVPKPAALVSTESASLIGLLLVAIGLYLGLRELRRMDALNIARATPLIILALVYGAIIAGWGG